MLSSRPEVSRLCGVAIPVIGIVVFVGLSAWDTQMIRCSMPGITTTRPAKVGGDEALSLYLSFISIFELLPDPSGPQEE